MNEKVITVLKMIATMNLDSNDYFELAHNLYSHHIAMEQMKPLDHLLDNVMNLYHMKKADKDFVIGEPLEFGQ